MTLSLLCFGSTYLIKFWVLFIFKHMCGLPWNFRRRKLTRNKLFESSSVLKKFPLCLLVLRVIMMNIISPEKESRVPKTASSLLLRNKTRFLISMLIRKNMLLLLLLSKMSLGIQHKITSLRESTICDVTQRTHVKRSTLCRFDLP